MFLNSRLTALAVAFTVSMSSLAKVSEEQAATLGKSLTPLGANPAANADKSIPPWTAKLPEKQPADTQQTAYMNEKPLFIISANNYTKYEKLLSEGQKALFKAYPETFKMPIYPSHRELRYQTDFEQRSLWNATNTYLDGDDGLKQYTGGIPFPVPQSGAEALWNARVSHPHPFIEAVFDSVAVFPGNKQNLQRSEQLVESPYAYSSWKIGDTETDQGPYAALVFARTLEPSRQKGEMIVIHEPLDWDKYSRKAWIYMPGTRRVRRAPNVGYDTPVGPGSLYTVDDSLGFNGGMDRYDWSLIGKREMFVPYHAYAFDQKIDYKTLLPTFHANPDYMRYERQRVWVVEAKLKKGKRHIYAKRRFYIAEDTWQILLTDAYDGKGELWRVGMLNSLYDFYLQAYIARAQIIHDLKAKAYIATRLINETQPVNYAMKPKGKRFYTPSNLRKLAK